MMVLVLVGSTWAQVKVLASPATMPAATVVAANAAGKTAAVKLDLARAIVIGASVSDGFGAMVTVVNPTAPKQGSPADKPKPQPVRLSEALGAVAGGEALPRHCASTMFFMNADTIAQQQIDAAIKVSNPAGDGVEPGIVFAIDYLFWHVYGGMPEEKRLSMLEKGLARLDQLKGPVVIGDLSDMRHATILGPREVPTKETLTAANLRLAQWVKGKANVAVVPLSEFVLAVQGSKVVTLGGHEYTLDESRKLMTADGLHATGSGLVALAQECLLQLKAKGLLAESATWETDPAKALARIKTSLPPGTIQTGLLNPKSKHPR